MAAARRIYNVGRATAGYFARAGYRSFGLRPLAHVAISVWSALRLRMTGDGSGLECTVINQKWLRDPFRRSSRDDAWPNAEKRRPG
ncbi:MAG TPA: hypothetical protein VGB15_05970, partial [Longimicrobium sp.]